MKRTNADKFLVFKCADFESKGSGNGSSAKRFRCLSSQTQRSQGPVKPD